MKPSGIGGQAVIEGVMMKNKDEYAVAVRRPDKEIEIMKCKLEPKEGTNFLKKLPIIRGVFIFAESIKLGMKTLTYSASFIEEDEEEVEKTEKEKAKDEKKESAIMALAVMGAVLLAIGIFMLLPFFASELLKKSVKSDQLLGLIEGVIRVVLFVGYVKLISLMQDIKRVFMYHGAEHKTINCIENGLPLTVENVKKQSKVHKRCGTSFLLVVMLISVLFFMFIIVDSVWLRMLFRILLIPVVAGVAYEFIRFAGRSESKVMDWLSRPGMWLQGLTTKEPTNSMIEVAIASVDAVFDWEAFLAEDDAVEQPIKEKAKKTEPISDSKVEQTKESSPELEDEIQMVDLDEEEEDDILKALDRYFDDPGKEKKS